MLALHGGFTHFSGSPVFQLNRSVGRRFRCDCTKLPGNEAIQIILGAPVIRFRVASSGIDCS